MTIGITGGTGVIGSILCKKLMDLSYTIDCFKGNISNKEDISNWIFNKKFDVLFHLAAVVPVNKVNQNPFNAYNVNVGGTINLLEAISNHELSPWIFYASTSHVYKSSNKPIKEEDEIQPLNIYGETKLIGEKAVTSFSNSFGVKICIGRIFSFYHSSQKPPYLHPTTLQRFNLEDLSKPFRLTGAKNIRDIMNAEHVVDILIKLMKLKYEGLINIGSGKGVTIEEFVSQQSDVPLNIAYDKNEPVSLLVADISKLNKVIKQQ